MTEFEVYGEKNSQFVCLGCQKTTERILLIKEGIEEYWICKKCMIKSIKELFKIK